MEGGLGLRVPVELTELMPNEVGAWAGEGRGRLRLAGTRPRADAVSLCPLPASLACCSLLFSQPLFF